MSAPATNWTATPAAAALLASCAATRPASEYIRSPYLRGREMDFEGWVYDRDDARVAQLDAIHGALTTAAMNANDRDGFAALCALSVDAAIGEAVYASQAVAA